MPVEIDRQRFMSTVVARQSRDRVDQELDVFFRDVHPSRGGPGVGDDVFDEWEATVFVDCQPDSPRASLKGYMLGRATDSQRLVAEPK